MPLLTDDSEPKKRRAAWWVLALVLLTIPPVALFAWSWVKPVTMLAFPLYLKFGRVSDPEMRLRARRKTEWGNEYRSVQLPGGPKADWYIVLFSSRVPD